MSKILRFTVLCFVLLLCAATAFAASQNAVVYGTVYDAAAKPLAGAKVTLENPAIAFSRSTTTAADGTYSFPEVPPASGYKVSASMGDKVIDIRGNITVQVGEESVIFPALKAQAAAKAVETSAKEMAVTTEKVATAQSGVITSEQLRSLPLYNRNFLTLGTLTPHTHPSGAADPLGDASFSVAGNRSTGNAFLLDGADNRASSSNQAVPFQVNDAIQEFSVISSAGNAEYGANGGTINVVTKRGGNSWHGTAFGYFGSDIFNSDGPLSVYNGGGFDQAAARAQNPTGTIFTFFPRYYNDYVNTAAFFGFCTNSLSAFTGVPGSLPCALGGTGERTLFNPTATLAPIDQHKMPWQSQQFGANMGFPLIKDKLFAFLGYEGTHIDNPTPILERVPSAFDKTYDPFATGTFGFTSTDPNYLVARSVMNFFPASNVVAVPGVLEFYQGTAPNNTFVHNAIGRLDWIRGPKDSFGVRYVGQLLNQLHDGTLPKTATYPGNGAIRDAFNSNLNVSYTHVFSSTLLNEAHAGFNRFNLKETPQDAKLHPDPGVLGMPGGFPGRYMPTFFLAGIDPQYSGAIPGTVGAYTGLGDFAVPQVQSLTLDGLFPFARIGAPLYAPSVRDDWSWFAADSIAWTKGRHQFKFGGEYHHFLNNLKDAGLFRGFVLAPNIGQFTSDAETCNQLCGEAFNTPSFDYAQKNFSANQLDLNSHEVAFFAEDTIRAYSRLTVTLGLRWEYYSRPLDQHDQLWNFDPLANGLVQQGSTNVSNQSGNPCLGPTTLTQFPIYPGLFGGTFGANAWDCRTSGVNGLDHTNWSNFMPRVGMAWDIFGDGNTVARFGAGMFYDREPTSYTSQLTYNRPTVLFYPNSTATGVPLPPAPAFQLPQAIYGNNFNDCGWGNATLNPTTMVTATNAICLSPGGQLFQAAGQPGAMYARDIHHDSTPRTWQINASIQHQFNNHLVAEAGYVGTYGAHLPVFFNQGFANEWFCSSSGSITGTCDNNSYAPVFMQTNRGESQYNSGFLRVRVADWHGLRVSGTYTFSNARDNASALVFPKDPLTMFNYGCGEQVLVANNSAVCSASGGFGSTGFNPSLSGNLSALTTTGTGQAITTPYTIPQDSGNFLHDDWGRSDYNSSHRFVMDWTWDVPSLQKKWGWSKYLDYWQFSGIGIIQSGQPYTIFSLIGNELSQRAVATGPVTTSSNPNSAISPTNLATAFSQCGAAIPDAAGATPFPANQLFLFAADGSQGRSCNGNTQRNGFNGPMFSTFNFAVQKGFPMFGESHMLSVRAEFYNLFGADNFYNPISLLSTDGALNPDFGKIKSAHDPRQIQFGVRYTW